MIERYLLQYNFEKNKDQLLICFDDITNMNCSKQNGMVESLYYEEKLIGYIIHNINKVIKIKSSGNIFKPSESLIEIINSILLNHKVEPLKYMSSSGFFVEKDAKGKHVYCLKGTILNPYYVIKEDKHICTYKDLEIEGKDEIFVFDENIDDGTDFFQMEEK